MAMQMGDKQLILDLTKFAFKKFNLGSKQEGEKKLVFFKNGATHIGVKTEREIVHQLINSIILCIC